MTPDWWKSALLGLVQGLTEFLPISSSAHLIAMKEVLAFEAGLAMDVALHVATLAAVLIYFRRDIAALVRRPRRGRAIALIVLATVPGVVLGYALSSWRSGIDAWWVVGGWSLSFAYLVTSRGRGGERRWVDLTPARSLLVGCAQALAIFPGVSRSGSSIVCGFWLGLDREEAFRFSFLLSIPLIAGAGLKTALDMTGADLERMGGAGALALAMGVALMAGLAAIHTLLGFVRTGRLHVFGWYNLAAAMAFALYLSLRG